jgi:hypothetical protein
MIKTIGYKEMSIAQLVEGVGVHLHYQGLEGVGVHLHYQGSSPLAQIWLPISFYTIPTSSS